MTRVAALACVLSACGGASDGVLDLAIAVNGAGAHVAVAGQVLDPGDQPTFHLVHDRITFSSYAALRASAPLLIQVTDPAGPTRDLNFQPGICAAACDTTRSCSASGLVEEDVDVLVDSTGTVSVGCYTCRGEDTVLAACP